MECMTTDRKRTNYVLWNLIYICLSQTLYGCREGIQRRRRIFLRDTGGTQCWRHQMHDVLGGPHSVKLRSRGNGLYTLLVTISVRSFSFRKMQWGHMVAGRKHQPDDWIGRFSFEKRLTHCLCHRAVTWQIFESLFSVFPDAGLVQEGSRLDSHKLPLEDLHTCLLPDVVRVWYTGLWWVWKWTRHAAGNSFWVPSIYHGFFVFVFVWFACSLFVVTEMYLWSVEYPQKVE